MQYDPQELLKEAESLYPTLRDIRRDLHAHPELGFEEVRTTAKIKEILSKLENVQIKEIDCPTGVIAEIEGTEEGTIGLRCDIDALPIQEENTHGFQSTIPGKMHACGHDGHITINLGAAMLLNKFRPKKTVRFLFQPAEETRRSGALDFLKAGAIEGLDEIWGFHLNATSDFGLVGWYDGFVMSGGFGFRLKVVGKGGHPAYPEGCINPVQVLSKFVVEMDSLKGKIRATRPFAFAFSSINSGSDLNPATPSEGTLTARCCYLDGELEEFLKDQIEKMAKHITDLYGATYTIEYFDGLPLCRNEPQMGGRVKDHAKLLGLPLEQIFPSMGGDDFGYYARKIPGYYMTYGIRQGKDFQLAHTPCFNFDEAILPKAAAHFASLALA